MPGATTEGLATDFRDSSREFTQFRENLAGFQGRVETKLAIIQWLGAFFATILMSVLGSLIWLAWHASAVNQRVGVLEQVTTKVTERLDKVDERLDKLDQATVRNGERLDKVDERLDKLEQATVRNGERLDKLEQATVRNGEQLDKLDQLMTRIADRLDHPLNSGKP